MSNHRMFPFGSLLIVIILDCLFVLFVICFFMLFWNNKQVLMWFSVPLAIILLSPISTFSYMIVRSKNFCTGMWICHGLVILAFIGFIFATYYYPLPEIDPSPSSGGLEIILYPIDFAFRIINIFFGLIGIILSLVSLSAISRIYFITTIRELENNQNQTVPSETPQSNQTAIDSTSQSTRDKLCQQQP